ncbi:hypothetical protein AKJ53_01430 [candidate division MSBL1 archaeon SCGC-AAA382F02]|uniref:Hemerythrin-like domain-containing protein n=1 Tax=candidate division MSBL1 archaeon SCGC-AAA382F02 TaxID=1698282 RepID=A0A133VI25_9EURY|nr:hypothetical protein AKJ53_01430 [candidate division MSBL1 archaeon SCGC-AAA382F02]
MTKITIDLIEEFSKDHYTVMEKLNSIADAADNQDEARIRTLAKELDELLGPHFYFEEMDLYPATKRFVGEERVEEYIEDHEPVAPTLENLKELEEISPEKAEEIKDKLTSFYKHVNDCEGTTVLVDALLEEEKNELASKFEKYRKDIGSLTSWKKES